MKLSIGFSIMALTMALTASSVLSAATDGERERDPEIYALQYDFGTARSLVVEPRWQSAPDDLVAILTHISSYLVVGKPTFANIGEEWEPGDAVLVGRPTAQHLFSAYSDDVAASVFLLGGHEIRVYAVLARRRAQRFCIFRLPELGLFSLRISEVQGELRPDRDQTISKIPKCQSQSLTQMPQFPLE